MITYYEKFKEVLDKKYVTFQKLVVGIWWIFFKFNTQITLLCAPCHSRDNSFILLHRLHTQRRRKRGIPLQGGSPTRRTSRTARELQGWISHCGVRRSMAQCRFNAGTTSTTLPLHWGSIWITVCIGHEFCLYWVYIRIVVASTCRKVKTISVFATFAVDHYSW